MWSEELLYRLIAAFGAGIGLLFAGGIGLLLARRGLRVRVVACSSVALASGLLTANFVPFAMALASAGAAVLGVLLICGIGLIRPGHVVTAFINCVQRPVAQSLLLFICGAVAMTGAVAQLTIVEEEATDRDMKWMLESGLRPDLQTVTDVSAATDRGKSIALWQPTSPRNAADLYAIEERSFPDLRHGQRLLRTGPPDETCNCHGWVFTGGKYWLAPEDVANILQDNGYQSVSDPRPGDVVIYRNAGAIAHTAVVHSALPGRPVMVEGKWGGMGIFLHAIDVSVYGAAYSFYRAARQGHVVVGLGGHSFAPSDRAELARPAALISD